MAKIEPKADSKIETATATSFTPAKTRSPNYPIYKLESALTKAQQLKTEYQRHAVPIKAAMEKLGFTNHNSSSASQAIAALKAFGLVDVTGTGDGRMVAVSEDAAKVMANHPSREAILKKAAVMPKLHAELLKKFMTAEGLAPDATIKHYLVFDRSEGKFNEESVETFIRQFKSTIAFAGLDSSALMSAGEAEDESDQEISVGDYVLWDSQGVAQFSEPRRVRWKSDDGAWLAVDGSETGLPVAELEKAQPTKSPAAAIPPIASTPIAGRTPPVPPSAPSKPLAAGQKQDIFTADTGEIVVRWPAILSEDDYADLEGWLDMLKRKIKRSVKGSDEEQN